MAKKPENGNMNYKQRMNELMESKRQLEKEARKMTVQCSHQNNKGRLKLTEIGNGSFECEICGERFSLDKLQPQEIDAAVNTLHNALQQIRCWSDNEQDRRLIIALGELDFNVREVPEIYEKVVNAYTRNQGNNKNKNKNKNKNRGGGFGSFGASNVSFLGGR